MQVRLLKLIHFRNYKALLLPLHERLTVLYGNNAQGKTNVLEAIYLCATGRSHRTHHDSELVYRGEEGAYVRTDLLRGNVDRRIELKIPRSARKQVRIDGAPILKMGDLMGCLNAVLFSPEELGLVKDGPGTRRRFLDVLLCQTDKSYFYALAAYQKALAQRNALLKLPAAAEEQFLAFEEQLGRYSTLLHKARVDAMALVERRSAQAHSTITGSREQLSVRFKSDLYGDELCECLACSREEDRRRGATTHGVHRDDFSILTDGADVRIYGSQGQQRTAALALKLSQLDYMESTTGEKPVLLLDDVLSELDSSRQQALLHAVRDYQTVLTCTAVPEGLTGDASLLKVVDGAIYQ